MNNPLVTIAIPAFKDAFFEDALKSVLNQTYSEIEVIVLDDFSPYDIASIVDKYQKIRPIRYIRNERNIGKDNLVGMWDLCHSHAKGEYFVLGADDDVYDCTFVEKLVELSRKYPTCDVFHCRTGVIGNEGELLSVAQPCCEFETQFELIYNSIIGDRKQVISDFMIRNQRLHDVGGFVSFPCCWYSDYATVFLLAQDGVVCSPDVLFYWRSSTVNISSDKLRASEKISAVFLFWTWVSSLLERIEPKDRFDQLYRKALNERLTAIIARHLSSHLNMLGLKKFCTLLLVDTDCKKLGAKNKFKLFLSRFRHTLARLFN